MCTHVPCRWRSVVGRENVTAQTGRYNNEHEELGVVLDGLEDDKFSVENGDAILANIGAVGGVQRGKVKLRNRLASGEVGEQNIGVRVGGISFCPVAGSRDRSRRGDCRDEGASDEFRG